MATEPGAVGAAALASLRDSLSGAAARVVAESCEEGVVSDAALQELTAALEAMAHVFAAVDGGGLSDELGDDLGALVDRLNGATGTRDLSRIYPAAKEAVDWASLLVGVLAGVGMQSISVLRRQASAWRVARHHGQPIATRLRLCAHRLEGHLVPGDDGAATPEMAATVAVVHGCQMQLRRDPDVRSRIGVRPNQRRLRSFSERPSVRSDPSAADFDRALEHLNRALAAVAADAVTLVELARATRDVAAIFDRGTASNTSPRRPSRTSTRGWLLIDS